MHVDIYVYNKILLVETPTTIMKNKNSTTEIHFKIHYFDVITVATCIYII